MSAPAAIAGSLVNLKNVGVHKSVALTIHVPEELAEAVLAAFGWPTASNPVPVAVARLVETARGMAPAAGPSAPLGKAAPAQDGRDVDGSASARSLVSNGSFKRDEVEALSKGAAEPQAGEASSARTRRPISLASKVAITCGSPTFHRFLRTRYAALAAQLEELAEDETELAAEIVRQLCRVESRRDIVPGSSAAETWNTLEAEYELAQRGVAA